MVPYTRIEEKVKTCIPCQASTPTATAQPLQMSQLPPEPWQVLAADLFGPLPTGERILVMKCLRSKWPEIKVFLRNQATDSENIIYSMEQMFAVHGIPEEVMTDNGPPFNGKKFADFASRSGFRHRKVTPLHPQANGQVERFMRSLGKVICTAVIQKLDWKKALNEFLMSYRATPHPATGASPAELMFPGRRFRTRLPAPPVRPHAGNVESKFQASQQKAKEYADTRRNAKEMRLSVGDKVLVKQRKVNKFSSPFSASPLTMSKVNESMITAADEDGKEITRNITHFKRLSFWPNESLSSAQKTQPPQPEFKGMRCNSATHTPVSRFNFPPDGQPAPQISDTGRETVDNVVEEGLSHDDTIHDGDRVFTFPRPANAETIEESDFDIPEDFKLTSRTGRKREKPERYRNKT